MFGSAGVCFKGFGGLGFWDLGFRFTYRIADVQRTAHIML